MKRTVRRLLAGFQRWMSTSEGGVAVLAYHLVGGGTDSPVDLPVDTFRRHLDEIVEHVPVVSLDTALERLDSRPSDPRTAVVLTFDDAYANFVDRVVPRLDAANLPATLYVPVGFVDGDAPAPLTGAEHLPAASWSALEDLRDHGRITLGSHSVTHRDLPRLPLDEIRRELTGSRDRLEDRLGIPVSHFCYPRGRVHGPSARLAGEIYATAAVGGGRRVRSGFDPSRLPRFPVRRDGPIPLSTAWTDEIWLEEWIAQRARRFLP